MVHQNHYKSNKRLMAAVSYDPRMNLQSGKTNHGVIVEEIEGVIRVCTDGHVERPPLVPHVAWDVGTEDGVVARDVVIDKFANLWARIYVPGTNSYKLPVLVYFHGGGFCVGSASWICYHVFLANLSSKAGCIILSVNYRLAPENRLPAAYDDGINSLMWWKQQAMNCSPENKWWSNRCNFDMLFVSGDSAGANIAYNVVTKLAFTGHSFDAMLKPLNLRGIILIQPFFGGETRVLSEKNIPQAPNSALTLSASDTYWRLALPSGATRDHPYCNPVSNSEINKLRNSRLPSILVCVSEMDILKDRNLEFCSALASTGQHVETIMYKGVGHAFQVLHNSKLSHVRTQEMISHIKSFVN